VCRMIMTMTTHSIIISFHGGADLKEVVLFEDLEFYEWDAVGINAPAKFEDLSASDLAESGQPLKAQLEHQWSNSQLWADTTEGGLTTVKPRKLRLCKLVFFRG